MSGMLSLRAVTLLFLITGAVQAYRRGSFSARDKRALIIILGACALLVGGVVIYVVYFLPPPAPVHG